MTQGSFPILDHGLVAHIATGGVGDGFRKRGHVARASRKPPVEPSPMWRWHCASRSITSTIPDMIPTTYDIIQANWQSVQARIHRLAPAQAVTVMAVTKYVGPTEVRWLHQAGATLIGENRVQDAQVKFADPQLSPYLSGVQKHLIGPLQRNKIPQALALFDCIHAIDRWSLLEALQSHLQRANRVMTGYVQLNAGREPQKHGFLSDELLATHEKIWSFPNVQIIGIIAVTPFSDIPHANRPYFREAFSLWQTIRSYHPQCEQLSMGMSHDFEVAIQEGATVVRLGSRLVSQPIEEVS